MLIQFQDVIKPYANLKRQHEGLVVKNDDPLKLGRIKCKVQGILECEDIEWLPWCFPKQGLSRGGRPDSAETATPPLHSIVSLEFPAFGDVPASGGNVYYPVWSGMNRVELTNPPIAKDNLSTPDEGMSEPYGVGASASEDLETNVWVKKVSENVAWIRIDKNRGSIELFDSDTGAVIYLDRGGHLQIQCTSLDVRTSEDVRFSVGGNLHFKVEGDTFSDTAGDTTVNSGASFGVKAANDIDMEAGDAVEVTAATTVGVRAGTDVGVTAGLNVAVQAGLSISEVAGVDFSRVAGATLSETAGALAARDAPIVADNSGLSLGPVATPPGRLGTIVVLLNKLADANATLEERFAALDRFVQSLLEEAAEVKRRGQEVLVRVREWAEGLVGKEI